MPTKRISELPYIDYTQISTDTLIPLVTYYSAVTGDTVHTTMNDYTTYQNTLRPQRYIANLTQTGGTRPSSTVLQNTLTEVPTYLYNSTGRYRMVFTATTLDPTTTYIMVGPQRTTTDGEEVMAYVRSSGEISISTLDGSSTLSDDILNNTTIEIRVY